MVDDGVTDGGRDVLVASLLGRVIQPVVRACLVLIVVAGLVVPLTAQLLEVDDGVPPAARWTVSVLMWAVAWLVWRMPLTDPATTLRNQARVEALPFALAAAGAGLQAFSVTPVITMFLLFVAILGAAISRRTTAVLLAVLVVAAQVTATVRSDTPDWLLTIGMALTVVLAVGLTQTLRAGYVSALRQELRERARSDVHVRGLRRVVTAARDVHRQDPETVLATVLEAARELRWDRALLYLPDAEGGGRVGRLDDDGTRVEVSDEPAPGLAQRVLASGETVVRAAAPPGQDGPADTAYDDTPPEYRGMVAAVGAPVVVGTRVTGALCVGRFAGEADESEVGLVELLAQQAGRALEVVEQLRARERAVEELEQLAALKDDFLATVSHELRTPLHIVLGMAQTLHHRWDQLTDVERFDMIWRLRRNAAGLTGVIETLLDFSRLEAGAIEPVFTETDVHAIAATIVERTADVAREHTVTLETLGAAPPTAYADGRLVERVIDNLVANAIRHTPDGTSVTVRTIGGEDATTVEILDDGPGIAASDLPHLTDRFYRAGDPLQRESRGVGLGLAFCSQVLLLHGSQLEVDSVEGQGATFRLTLSRAPMTATPVAAAASSSRVDPIPGAAGTGR